MSRIFNGTSDFLEWAAGTAFTGAAGFTVSCWLKPASNATGTVLGYGSNTGNSEYWALLATATPAGFFERNVGSASDSTGGSVPASAWNHLAAVVTTITSALVYVNGVAGTTDTNSKNIPNNPNIINVGCLMSNGTRISFRNGRIGEAAIWNTALTAGQITSLNGGSNPTTIAAANLIGYWQIKGVASPEPSYQSLYGGSLTVTGTTTAVGDDPPVNAPAGGVILPPQRSPLGV